MVEERWVGKEEKKEKRPKVLMKELLRVHVCLFIFAKDKKMGATEN